MPDIGICPVCTAKTFLVRHRDHFGDNCIDILTKHFQDIHAQRGGDARSFYSSASYTLIQQQHDSFYTFPDTYICQPCNMICAGVKKVITSIPRWVSFSPDEMILLRADPKLLQFSALWATKKETYRLRLRALIKSGVEQAVIERMWRDRSRQSYSNTEQLRTAMLRRLADAVGIENLSDVPGNERSIAKIMRREGWTSREANSFIYWYHKKHGDPSCRHNQFGIGEMGFVEWFRELVVGDTDKAEAEMSRRLYWAKRERRQG